MYGYEVIGKVCTRIFFRYKVPYAVVLIYYGRPVVVSTETFTFMIQFRMVVLTFIVRVVFFFLCLLIITHFLGELCVVHNVRRDAGERIVTKKVEQLIVVFLHVYFSRFPTSSLSTSRSDVISDKPLGVVRGGLGGRANVIFLAL